jgi:hypothetical protein
MERIIPLKHLTLKRMFKNESSYIGISEGLTKMPLPESFRLTFKNYAIPESVNELCDNICYGQKVYLSKQDTSDLMIIIRKVAGYYYPIVTGNKWDEEAAIIWSKRLFNCLVVDLYPIATHLTNMVAEMIKKEYDLLHREPKKEEKIAGIDRLSKYAELDAIDFLSDVLKLNRDEVLLTPYNTCLVRFMQAKDKAVFSEKLTEVYKSQAEKKNKFKN